jgi:hypothetical protein
MVGVAQLVEHKVVALVAAGSSPVAHPKLKYADGRRTMDEGRENASLVSANVVTPWRDRPSVFYCARSSAGYSVGLRIRRPQLRLLPGVPTSAMEKRRTRDVGRK